MLSWIALPQLLSHNCSPTIALPQLLFWDSSLGIALLDRSPGMLSWIALLACSPGLLFWTALDVLLPNLMKSLLGGFALGSSFLQDVLVISHVRFRFISGSIWEPFWLVLESTLEAL